MPALCAGHAVAVRQSTGFPGATWGLFWKIVFHRLYSEPVRSASPQISVRRSTPSSSGSRARAEFKASGGWGGVICCQTWKRVSECRLDASSAAFASSVDVSAPGVAVAASCLDFSAPAPPPQCHLLGRLGPWQAGRNCVPVSQPPLAAQEGPHPRHLQLQGPCGGRT